MTRAPVRPVPTDAPDAADSPDSPDSPDLPGRLAALDLVLSDGAGQLDRRTLAAARRLRRRADQRLRLAGEHTVVALAGGTGSGKSTLFNALAGLDLSATGLRRPTTQAPYACVWGPDPATDLLDWLEVPPDRRVARESELDAGTDPPLLGLVLLDLPDHDSIEVTHRLEVDRLVELVDVLVWVLDPEKYADDAVHEDYLRPLHDHADVMIVVLNQADRLAPAQAQACAADLRRLLADDGIAGVRMLSTSAVTGAGVGDLRDALGAAVASRQAKLRRVAAGLDALAPRLRQAARAYVDPARVEALAGPAAAALAEVVGVDAIAATEAARHAAVGRRRTGWPLLAWRAGNPPAPAARPGPPAPPEADVERVARQSAGALGLAEPWRTRLDRRAAETAPGLAAGLATEADHAPPAPEPPHWRRVAAAQRALLALAVAGVLLAIFVSPPAGLALTVAALAAGWAIGTRVAQSVESSAEECRHAVTAALRERVAGRTRGLLIEPLLADVAAHNAVQEALQAAAGTIRLSGA